MFNSRKELPMAKQDPQLQATAVAARKLSHDAAPIVQRISNLEDDLAEMTQVAAQQRNRAEVAEEITEQLKGRLEQLQKERDYYHHLFTSIQAKSETVAKVLLDIFDETKRDAYAAKPAPAANVAGIEGVKGVDGALSDWGAPTTKPPAFLLQTEAVDGQERVAAQ